MTLRWLPNAITIARMVVAAPLLWLLLQRSYGAALWLVVLAGVSDVVDGFLAKRFDCRTALGGLLDPIADKLLLAACFLGLWWSQRLPSWLVLLVLGRDVIIVIGAFVHWRWVLPFKPAPSFIGKMTTLAQIVLAAGLLAHEAVAALPFNLLLGLMLATALLTSASGLDYVDRYGLRAWRALGSRA